MTDESDSRSQLHIKIRMDTELFSYPCGFIIALLFLMIRYYTTFYIIIYVKNYVKISMKHFILPNINPTSPYSYLYIAYLGGYRFVMWFLHRHGPTNLLRSTRPLRRDKVMLQKCVGANAR